MINGAHVIIYSTDAIGVLEERWGRLTRISMPGGGKLSMYPPKHPTAHG